MSGRSITPKEALDQYGSFRLASHIDVYRKLGYRIRTETVQQGSTEFARYHYEGQING